MKRHNILPTRTSLIFSTSGKSENVQEFKVKPSSSCIITDDIHVKIVWLHIVVFTKHDILHFWDDVDLSKY